MVNYNIDFKEEIDVNLKFNIINITKDDTIKIYLYLDTIFNNKYTKVFLLEKKRKYFYYLFRKLIGHCIEIIKNNNNNNIYLSEYIQKSENKIKKFTIKNYSSEINNKIKKFVIIIIKEIFFIFDLFNHKLNNKTIYDIVYNNDKLKIHVKSLKYCNMVKIYDLNFIYNTNKLLSKYNFLTTNLIDYIIKISREIYNIYFKDIEYNFELFVYDLLNLLCDYYYNITNNINFLYSIYRKNWIQKYINHNKLLLTISDFFFNNLDNEEIYFQEITFNTFHNITTDVKDDIFFKKNIIRLLQIDFYYKCNSISFF